MQLHRTDATTERALTVADLTHIDAEGRAHMVDVSDKSDTLRTALATGTIAIAPDIVRLVREGKAPKGAVEGVAEVAGIMAAKRTSELIPLCHPLPLSAIAVAVSFSPDGSGLTVTATARTTGPTGVEMEALTAATVALLTIYDMLKAADKAMVIGGVRLLEKHGGRSGSYRA